MDIGTGSGGILDELSPLASNTIAVEPQKIARYSLKKLGYDVYPNIESVPVTEIDVVTLFHVFEHFTNPLDDLKLVHQKWLHKEEYILKFLMRETSNIIFEHESFKRFTFWSEHLILHTRQSLTRFLKRQDLKILLLLLSTLSFSQSFALVGE